MRKAVLPTVLLTALTACAAPTVEPAVSQYNGDSVSIQLDGGALMFASDQDRAAVNAKADARAVEICQRGHRKRAEFTSTRNIPTGQYTYVIERLYLCLN